MIWNEPRADAWPGFAAPAAGSRHLVAAVYAALSDRALDAFVLGRAPFAEWIERGRATWWVQPGEGAHAAFVTIEHDASGLADELAEALAAHTGAPAYRADLAGWDDPDEGSPTIWRFGADPRELWSAMSLEECLELYAMFFDDFDEAEVRATFAGHDASVGDPWQHAASLGIVLPPYRAP